MKAATSLAAFLVTLSSLPLMAQHADAVAAQATTVNVAMNPVHASANAVSDAVSSPRDAARWSALRERLMRPVSVDLMGRLDSKSNKTGDAVELRTRELVTTADGMGIPKGTKIMGHVISVESHGKERANSEVALQFDRAELKSGQSLAIRSEIRWVEPSPSAALATSTPGQDAPGSGTKVMGGAHMGGLGGGFTGGSTVSNGRIIDLSKAPQGPNWVANYGLQAGGTANGGAAEDPEAASVLAATQRFTAHPTGVPGVMLASDASGKLSGTFSASGQNVHLDGGARMVLDIMPAK